LALLLLTRSPGGDQLSLQRRWKSDRQQCGDDYRGHNTFKCLGNIVMSTVSSSG
jgi:hypothetical protein